MTKFNKIKAALAILTVPMFLVFVSPGSTSAAGPVIRQGTTASFAVLAASTITNTGATNISGTAGGDIGLYAGTSFTGSGTVTTTGVQHITDAAASTAQTDLVTAYNDLLVPTPTTLTNPDLAAQVILPGTYNTAAGTFSNSGHLTLDANNDPSAIFIFQAASTVITSTSSSMTLLRGAQACNVYWQVGSSATLGVTSTFIGHIYAQTSITANTGASIQGQLLARTGAVTLAGNTIVNDNCAPVPTPTPTVSTTPTPTPTVCTSVISNLRFTTGGSGTSTGKLDWTTTGGSGLYQYVGDASLYPAPFTYGTRTSSWNGSLVGMLPGTSYPVAVRFFADCGKVSQVSVIIINLASVTPTPTPVAPATLNVVKHVVNTYGGTASASDFTIHVTHNGVEVAGSPAVGADGAGHAYSLAPGTYLISETHVDGYYGTFAGTDPALGGNITADGLITLVSGQVATIVRTNYQVAPAYVPAPAPSASPVPPTPVTETGGKLPKTGSPWYNLLALGAGLVLLGGVGFGTKKVLR